MEQRVGMTQRLLRSITDFNVYVLYPQETLGKAMLYVLLLSVLATAIMGGHMAWTINDEINELAGYVNSEIPWFEIVSGQLHMDADMPYILEDEAQNVLIVDTTGMSGPSVLDQYQEGILITRDSIYRKKNQLEISQISLGQLNINLSKEQLLNLIPLLKLFSYLVVFFVFLFLVVAAMFSSLVVSAIGQLFNRQKLPFASLYKMSLYALTLPMLLFVILNALAIAIPYFFWIYHGIALLYLKRAIDAMGGAEPPALYA